MISTSLYFVVFAWTLGNQRSEIDGVPFVRYIVPGLVFLGIANNAFLNASSSFFITKIQNTLVDLLVAPLGPAELLLGFISGAMTCMPFMLSYCLRVKGCMRVRVTMARKRMVNP